MRDAASLAIADLHARNINVKAVAPQGAQAVENPHQDEGTDNSADVAAAPAIARAAAHAGIRILIGPLRTNVAVAEDLTLRRFHEIAISGTAGGPSEPDTPVFRLAPSERQLARLAYAAMRRQFGKRVCVLNDNSDDGRRRAAIMGTFPGVTLGKCVAHSDAVYFATTSREPVFCSARTALRANPRRLLVEISHRGFNPGDFTRAGALYRARARPIPSAPATQEVAKRYHEREFVLPDDGALRTYAAVQVAVQALERLRGPRGLGAIMQTQTFSTILGPVRFRRDGDPANPAMEIVRLN